MAHRQITLTLDQEILAVLDHMVKFLNAGQFREHPITRLQFVKDILNKSLVLAYNEFVNDGLKPFGVENVNVNKK